MDLQVISDGSSIANGLCFLDSYDRRVDRKPFGIAFSIPIVEFDISCSIEIGIEGETALNALENRRQPKKGRESEGDQALLLPDIIKAEVNFLVFPFFALSRKGLRAKLETEYREVKYQRINSLACN